MKFAPQPIQGFLGEDGLVHVRRQPWRSDKGSDELLYAPARGFVQDAQGNVTIDPQMWTGPDFLKSRGFVADENGTIRIRPQPWRRTGGENGEDAPALICSTSPTLEMVLGGITGCGCTQTPSGKFQTTTIIDLSGPYTLNTVAPATWNVIGVGSGHVAIYDDAFCTILSDEFDCTFTISAFCISGGYFSSVSIHEATADTQPNIYSNITGILGRSMSNDYTACSVNNAATGGAATLSA